MQLHVFMHNSGGGNIEIPSSESNVFGTKQDHQHPSTFLVWLNKPGVSRIVTSRTPIFHFSRPLSILHAAIKQKSSNHTESPLPFTPTPQPPPHQKKKPIHCPTVQLAPLFCSPFTVFASPRHSNGWDVTRSFHGCVPTSLATPRCASSSSTPCCWSYHLRAKTVPSGKPVVSVCFFCRGKNCEKINSKYLSVVFLLFVE